MQYKSNKTVNQKQVTFINKLISQAEEFLQVSINLKDSSDKNFEFFVYTFLLTKYLRTFKALMVLISNQFGEDALMLSRILQEIWVRVKHMDSFTQEHLLLNRFHFCESYSDDIKRYRTVHGTPLPDDLDYGLQQTFGDENAKKLIEELRFISSKLADEVQEAREYQRSEFWPGKSTFQMLREIHPDLSWYHVVGYKIPSDFIHSSTGVFDSYLEQENYVAKPRVKPGGAFGLAAACSSSENLIEILQCIDSRFNYNRKSEIELLVNEFNNVFNVSEIKQS